MKAELLWGETYMENDKLREMVLGLLETVTKLEERVLKLERDAEETGTGVYYDHADKEYVKYIQEGLGKARRGEE